MRAGHKTRLAIAAALIFGAQSAYAQLSTDTVSSDASNNTGVGTGALFKDQPTPLVNFTGAGDNNTAVGAGALSSNVDGTADAAFGVSALGSNTSGNFNTAAGAVALFANTTGTNNSAFGFAALESNTTGTANTGVGQGALAANTVGNYNNAVGYESLNSSNSDGVGSDGSFNNAVGYKAMYATTTGYNNNAQGSYALAANTTGYGNSAMGANSLLNLTTGFRNVGVGNNTGTSLVAGSYNVDIGWGVTGSGDETGVVRIGNTSFAAATYIAGVYGVGAGGTYVCATSNGQLSTGASCAAPSSRRYKEDIQPLTDTERLMKLQPVRFRYRKADASGNKPLEFGLIAEEVAQVFPDLVVYDEKGQPDAVKYQALAPLLLKKVQEQSLDLALTRERLATAEEKLATVDKLQKQMAQLEQTNEAMQLAMARLMAKDEQVAMR